MPASQPANFNLQEFTDVGQLLVGGRIYTYAYGTTAQKVAYTDPDGTVPHTYTLDGAGGQYIALNARGELPAPLYLGDGSYDISLKRPDGSTVWTRKADGINSVGATTLTALAASAGAGLVGFLAAGAGAIARWVQDKLRERISVADYGSGIGQGDATKDTAAILAAVAAVKQAYYDKGCADLYFPTPAVPYRLNQTIDLTEVWNVTLSSGNAFGFQRQQVDDPTTDNALIQWYGDNISPMMRLHYTFGMRGDRVSLNGRGIAKIGIAVAPSTSVASVTRKIDFESPVIKNCDFGIVIGDLGAQTDNAPVDICRPHISGCKSAGILVNSGNASVNIGQAFMINNGYAPTIGNSFISDGNNRGGHLNVVAGVVGVTDLTTDSDASHGLAGAAIVQASGSLRVNGAWCDDPTKPFYSGFADGPIYFHGVRHYDASMTLASTPNSIEYNGPQPLELASCYLYGNVSITSGNQASVIDLGTRFVRAGAGFVGNMVTQYGGLIRMARTENNALGLSIGGDFPTSVFGPYHSATIWSDHNRPGLIRAARNGGYMVTEHINSVNGQLYMMGNARFDADAGQYKAIAPGACWRHTYGKNTESYDTYQASAAGEVIATWGNVHGFLPGVGANAITILSLSGQKLTWDSTAPTTGTWSKGDKCFNLNATAGQPREWGCTVAGSPGTWSASATY